MKSNKQIKHMMRDKGINCTGRTISINANGDEIIRMAIWFINWDKPSICGLIRELEDKS